MSEQDEVDAVAPTLLEIYDEEEYGQVDQEDRDALREKLHDQTRLGDDE